MSYLLLATLFGFVPIQDGQQSYRNVQAFTSVDWVDGGPKSGSYQDENNRRVKYSNENYNAMSLTQGKAWHNGTAWIFTATTKSTDGSPDIYTALKGTYDFLSPGEEESNLIILRLSLQRQYLGEREGQEIKWNMRTKFEPVGVSIEIPHDDGNVVPDDKLVLSVTRAFFVDVNGREIERRYEPDGLIDGLFGTDVKRVRSLPFASIGETLNMRPQNGLLASIGLEKSAPPGFRIRTANRSDSGTLTSDQGLGNSAAVKEKREAASAAFNASKYDEAITLLDEVIKEDPKDSWAFYVRGQAKNEKNEYESALSDYKEAIRLNPEDALAINNAAWILATCGRSKIRNGKLALEYAKKACALSNYADGFYLDTLAAAYAESGDFAKAVLWQTEAVEIIDDEYKEDAQKRLKGFEEGKPAREW